MINYDYCNSNVDMFVDQLSEKLNLNPPSDFCIFNKIYNDLLDKNFKLKPLDTLNVITKTIHG